MQSPDAYVLTPREAAVVLGVSAATVVKWANAGELRCIRLPSGFRRFRRSDIDEFLERARRDGPTPVPEGASTEGVGA